MTRDERQTDVLTSWVTGGCRGTVIAATGLNKNKNNLLIQINLLSLCINNIQK